MDQNVYKARRRLMEANVANKRIEYHRAQAAYGDESAAYGSAREKYHKACLDLLELNAAWADNQERGV